MRMLVLAFVLAACSDRGDDTAALRVRPAGSQIGTVCFEHQVEDGGWELVSVRSSDGRLPPRTVSVTGNWYFPMDAGPLRLGYCSPY